MSGSLRYGARHKEPGDTDEQKLGSGRKGGTREKGSHTAEGPSHILGGLFKGDPPGAPLEMEQRDGDSQCGLVSLVFFFCQLSGLDDHG